MDQKSVVVIGATGTVGYKFCQLAHAADFRIAGAARNMGPLLGMYGDMLISGFAAGDVTQLPNCRHIAGQFSGTKYNYLVYAVGNCPPGGYAAYEKKPYPLPQREYEGELLLHAGGLQNVLEVFVPDHMAEGAKVLVVNAAITELPDDVNVWPGKLRGAAAYRFAKKGQESVVCHWRDNPIARKKRISFELIKPGPIAGPFFDRAQFPPIQKLDPYFVATHMLDMLTGPERDQTKVLQPTDS